MLTITIDGEEFFNEETQEFTTVGNVTLELEHSLASMSKWESKWEVPFLGKDVKTSEQTYDYFKMMLLTENVDPNIVYDFSPKQIDEIQEYIDSKQSATTFGDMPQKPGAAQVITTELIYFWLSAFTIPFSVENWHINRVFSLIRIANQMNQPPKKMSKRDIAMQYREENERRKAELNTRG